MSSSPNPMELLERVGELLATTERAGVVVVNAIYKEDPREYLPNLTVDGIVNGWLVFLGGEDEPTRSSAGFEQVSNVLLTPAVGAGGTIDGEETWDYFGKKVQEAKDLFALSANEGLGFAIDGVRVRNRLLRAPGGYFPIEENELAVWVGPDMVLPVWISHC